MNKKIKINQLIEHRETRVLNDEYISSITANFISNFAIRSCSIHEIIKNKKKSDDNFIIMAGSYVASLVTCWETFFRDLFIFVCETDEILHNKIFTEEKINEFNLLSGEYKSIGYNFQNLEGTNKALNYINCIDCNKITEHFEYIFTAGDWTCSQDFLLICKWKQDGVFEENINYTLKKAFEIRHKVIHDSNYRMKFDPELMHSIESVFLFFLQLVGTYYAKKYNQKCIAIKNFKNKTHFRLTNKLKEDEYYYIMGIKDFEAKYRKVD